MYAKTELNIGQTNYQKKMKMIINVIMQEI